MIRRWSTVAVTVWWLLGSCALLGPAARAEGISAPAAPRKILAPIALPAVPMTITSDRMMIREADHLATFEGRVVVRQGDLTVKADRLEVRGNGSKAASVPGYGSQNISTITASGHVEVVHGEQTARADKAVYDQARQQIELIGNLAGEEGGYQLAGARMIIYLQERRSVIEGSRVVIPPGFSNPSGATPADAKKRAASGATDIR